MIKIFIVEDDPLLVKMYDTAFTRAGYEVETAFDGEDGFSKLSAMSVKPTLVLSDIMMPKVNGLEMLQKIKADPRLKNMPVVLLTNLGGEEDAEKGLSLGAVTYLVKSQYEPKEVVEKIKEIIAGYTRDGEVPQVKVPVKKIDSDKK